MARKFAGALLVITLGVVIGGLLIAAGDLADATGDGLGFVLAGFLVAGLGIASGLWMLTHIVSGSGRVFVRGRADARGDR